MKVGDSVRLKSGGPTMTVNSVGDRLVECVWFNEVGTSQTGTFPPATLVSDESPLGEGAGDDGGRQFLRD